MLEVWLALAAVIGGLVGLVWSADKFVDGSASIAWSFGISPLVVGLTIVSLGTSAPEVVVSVSASLREAGELAVGNAVGSNLANIGLVLAVTALVARLPIQKHLLRHEIPVLLLVTLLGGLTLADAQLTRLEGALLVGSLPPVLAYLVWAKQRHLTPAERQHEQGQITVMSRGRALLWFAIGLLALIASAEVLVWGAKRLALAAGVSPLIVGLTLIAFGTSLPELAASVLSARRGLQEIALGNIVGSNIFNLLAVMGLPGLLDAPTMEASVFARDYLCMAAITALLALFAYAGFARRGRPGLGLSTGLLLLVTYGGYYLLLLNSL